MVSDKDRRGRTEQSTNIHAAKKEGGVHGEADLIEISAEKREVMQKTLTQILKRFNIDWKIMRAVMLTTGAVISGSVALAVLQAGEFVPQDLNIYVTSTNLAVLLIFLNEQGYTVQMPKPTTTSDGYNRSTVTLTLKNDAGERIDLIATIEQHVIHTITQFHSTCVMNYIAYYGIVCLYPEWTMRKMGLVTNRPTDQQAIDKYRGRGFAMVYRSEDLPGYEPNHQCGRHQCCLKTRRELRDHITLSVPLEDVELSVHTDEGMVGWVLQKDYNCELAS